MILPLTCIGRPGFEAPDFDEYRTLPDSLARKMGAGWPGIVPAQADSKKQ
jgi:hypothetical protein